MEDQYRITVNNGTVDLDVGEGGIFHVVGMASSWAAQALQRDVEELNIHISKISPKSVCPECEDKKSDENGCPCPVCGTEEQFAAYMAGEKQTSLKSELSE